MGAGAGGQGRWGMPGLDTEVSFLPHRASTLFSDIYFFNFHIRLFLEIGRKEERQWRGRGERKRGRNISLVYLKSTSVGGGVVSCFLEHIYYFNHGLCIRLRAGKELQKLSSY